MESNVFHRLNQAEPFVAIRLLVMQAGIALGLYWIGTAGTPMPEDLRFFPVNLMGVFNIETVIGFGYPMRELVWSGEWWRVLVGVFLPPGLGWFAFSIIAMLPLGKILEEEVGRIWSFVVYVAGGVAVIATDMTTSAVISAGSVGMVFAAGGSVLVKLLLDRREGPEKLAGVPSGTWMALLLLWVFSLTLSYSNLIYRPSVEFASVTQIGPSQKALLAALMLGACWGVPLLVIPRHEAPAGSGPHRFPSRMLAGLFIVPAIGLGLLAALCVYSWERKGRLDFALWAAEPLLASGDAQVQISIQELSDSHPEDLFLAKRLAISYASNRQYEQAGELLKDLYRRVEEKWQTSRTQEDYIERRSRFTYLSRRGSGQPGPWRRSGFSVNYDIDPMRLLWDRGHVAYLGGASDELGSLRENLLHLLDNMLITRSESGKEEEQMEAVLNKALVMNHRAYVRVELGGDLAAAIQEASLSVSLSPSGDNLDTLGWIEVQSGKLKEGVAHLEKALLYNEPRSAGTIHFHTGVAYQKAADAETQPDQKNSYAEKAVYHLSEALKYDLDWWDEIVLKNLCPECLDRAVSTTNPESILSAESSPPSAESSPTPL